MDVLYYIAIIAMTVGNFWVWSACGVAILIFSRRLLAGRKRFSSLAYKLLMSMAAAFTVIVGVYMLFIGLYQFWYTHRPLPTATEQSLYNGITYIRDVRSSPRALAIHSIRVQLDAEGIRFLVTPGDPTQAYSLKAQTTSQFLDRYDLQLAINGDFFEPWWSNGIFDYYPHVGDGADPLGFASSEGVTYSEQLENHPTLYISQGNHPSLVLSNHQTYNAISGNIVIVSDGEVILSAHERYLTDLHPRTAIGWTEDKTTLLIVVVDGRQPNYSEGVSLYELAEIMQEYGAYTALNLDGGGSSTLVMEGEFGEPIVLNSPIDQRIPGRERPIANHLGVYASR
jgi:hypothetical protein